jgi:hypothetical protein
MSQAQMQLLTGIGGTSMMRGVGAKYALSAGARTNPTTDVKASLDLALKQIFPSHREETQIQRARAIMGAEVCELSDADLNKHLTQFQSLIDGWLDEFERQNFEGSTLRQMFNGD